MALPNHQPSIVEEWQKLKEALENLPINLPGFEGLRNVALAITLFTIVVYGIFNPLVFVASPIVLLLFIKEIKNFFCGRFRSLYNRDDYAECYDLLLELTSRFLPQLSLTKYSEIIQNYPCLSNVGNLEELSKNLTLSQIKNIANRINHGDFVEQDARLEALKNALQGTQLKLTENNQIQLIVDWILLQDKRLQSGLASEFLTFVIQSKNLEAHNWLCELFAQQIANVPKHLIFRVGWFCSNVNRFDLAEKFYSNCRPENLSVGENYLIAEFFRNNSLNNAAEPFLKYLNNLLTATDVINLDTKTESKAASIIEAPYCIKQITIYHHINDELHYLMEQKAGAEQALQQLDEKATKKLGKESPKQINRVLSELQDTKSVCPITLDTIKGRNDIVVTDCCHAFTEMSIKRVIVMKGQECMCPICKQPIRQESLIKVPNIVPINEIDKLLAAKETKKNAINLKHALMLKNEIKSLSEKTHKLPPIVSSTRNINDYLKIDIISSESAAPYTLLQEVADKVTAQNQNYETSFEHGM